MVMNLLELYASLEPLKNGSKLMEKRYLKTLLMMGASIPQWGSLTPLPDVFLVMLNNFLKTQCSQSKGIESEIWAGTYLKNTSYFNRVGRLLESDSSLTTARLNCDTNPFTHFTSAVTLTSVGPTCLLNASMKSLKKSIALTLLKNAHAGLS